MPGCVCFLAESQAFMFGSEQVILVAFLAENLGFSGP